MGILLTNRQIARVDWEGCFAWLSIAVPNRSKYQRRVAKRSFGDGIPKRSLGTSCEQCRQRFDSQTSRPFGKPGSGRIAVKVINHLGDELMKVYWD